MTNERFEGLSIAITETRKNVSEFVILTPIERDINSITEPMLCVCEELVEEVARLRKAIDNFLNASLDSKDYFTEVEKLRNALEE